MAPALGADHSITPESAGAGGLALYEAYGPLFAALAGACWHLAARPVVVEAGPPAAVANAFTRGGGCTAPGGVGGGAGPVAELLLYAWAGPGAGAAANSSVLLSFVLPPGLGRGADASASGLGCEAVRPDGAGWAALQPPPVFDPVAQRWRFAAPVALGRGSVLVRCSSTS